MQIPNLTLGQLQHKLTKRIQINNWFRFVVGLTDSQRSQMVLWEFACWSGNTSLPKPLIAMNYCNEIFSDISKLTQSNRRSVKVTWLYWITLSLNETGAFSSAAPPTKPGLFEMHMRLMAQQLIIYSRVITSWCVSVAFAVVSCAFSEEISRITTWADDSALSEELHWWKLLMQSAYVIQCRQLGQVDICLWATGSHQHTAANQNNSHSCSNHE